MIHKLLVLVLVFSGLTLGQYFKRPVLQRMVSNQPCISSADCKLNSHCKVPEKYCECDEGWLVVKNYTFYECVPFAKTIYDPCSQQLQCTYNLGENAYCESSEQRCECKDGAYFNKESNYCFKLVSIGEQCHDRKECLLPSGTYAYCLKDKCTCADYQMLSEDGRCIDQQELGHQCQEDANCEQVRGQCIGICACRVGEVVSNNGTVCLKAAADFGDSCEQLSQCNKFLEGGECINNKCWCNSDHHHSGIRCYKSVPIGEDCSSPLECYNNGLTEETVSCTVGVCRCKDGDYIEGQCVKKSTDSSARAVFCATLSSFMLILILLK